MRIFNQIITLLILISLSACMKWDYGEEFSNFTLKEKELFILCEGNFQYGNASLSCYDPSANQVENEVFFRANGMRLGDVAQSMTIHNGIGWIVVNNSHVIFAIDTQTFRELGRIENLTSPRYIFFIDDQKAYVTQIWDNRIAIVNPKTFTIIGYIEVPDMEMGTGSTEQMVRIGKYVYCNCWSYQDRIIKIDTETDEVVECKKVGLQPNSLVKDKNGYLWVLTDGGLEDSFIGTEKPSLLCLNSASLSIEKKFLFNYGEQPSELQINSEGDTLYWINDDIWKMGIEENNLPSVPIIPSNKTRYYGLTINPKNSEIYVSDAIDYSQQGIIYRYKSDGELLDRFYVGVNPGAFCWNKTGK